jgi:hypothetical protein
MMAIAAEAYVDQIGGCVSVHNRQGPDAVRDLVGASRVGPKQRAAPSPHRPGPAATPPSLLGTAMTVYTETRSSVSP